MNAKRLWLVLLGGGIAAGAVFFLRLVKPAAPANPPEPIRLLPPAASAPELAATTAASPAAVVRFGVDLRAEIAALRDRGLDEDGIREIITNELKGGYAREQYRMEMLLEQARYPKHYWEPALPVEAVYELERTRQGELARIDQELNGTLTELFGADATPPPARAPFFSPDSPGPKIDFLPDAAQKQLTDALWARDPDGRMSSVDRLDLARQMLTPDEFALYTKWNSPASTALSSQLVSFQPTQAEYDAIFTWQSVADSADGFPNEQARAEAANELKAALGDDRYAAFQHLQDPAYQTVVQVLNRWSLPLSKADAVLALRQSAISAMDAVWQDTATPDEEKSARVEKLRQQYRQQITDQLGVPAGLVPDDDLL